LRVYHICISGTLKIACNFLDAKVDQARPRGGRRKEMIVEFTHINCSARPS
jgi:hypothetical protein